MTALGLVPLQLATFATALSLLIIPIVWRFAPRWGLVDLPDSRKVHSIPVPRVGGWGITLGALVPLIVWGELDGALVGYVLGCLILFLFGIWDDSKDISHWAKFIGQIVASSAVVYGGGLYVSRIPFFDTDALAPYIGQPFTILALVGVINAINHADGLDGLAAGESLLSLIGLLVLGYQVESAPVVAVTLAVLGGILGFLRYNSYPARVFMGDAGSQVLGLTLGVLAIYLTQRADTAVSAVTPLLVIGVPIIDILSVLFLRIRSGANWFKASRNHLHHRLLDLGLSHFQAVIVVYSAQAAFVLAAILLRYNTDWNVCTIYVLLAGSMLLSLTVLERRKWHLLRPASANDELERGTGFTPQRKARIARGLIMVGAPGFMLFAASWSTQVPRELGLITCFLGALLVLDLLLVLPAHTLILRVIGYVAAIASAYLMGGYQGHGTSALVVGTVIVILTLTLIVAIAVYAHSASRDGFGATPTDYLFILVLVALLALAFIDVNARSAVQLYVYTVVLLYGCEIVLGRGVSRSSPFAFCTLVTLSVMAFRGLA